MELLSILIPLLQFSLAVAVLAQSAVALSVLEGGMLTLVMALCVCAVSKCPGHEDSDCEDRLVSEDDRPSSPASSIGDKMDMHIADRDGFPPADNEPKPNLLCAAETPLGSLADGSLKPAVTAPTCDTNPACPKPDALDGSDTDALDFTICSCLHASGCPLVIIDHSADEIAAYKPAGSGAYRLMFQTFTKHWAGVQQAWDTIQALKARATDRLQQALRCRFDMTQIGSDLVLEYLAQTVCELETQAVWDLQEAGQWEVEWQVRLQAMQLAVREAKAVAEHGWLESVVSVPGFVV